MAPSRRGVGGTDNSQRHFSARCGHSLTPSQTLFPPCDASPNEVKPDKRLPKAPARLSSHIILRSRRTVEIDSLTRTHFRYGDAIDRNLGQDPPGLWRCTPIGLDIASVARLSRAALQRRIFILCGHDGLLRRSTKGGDAMILAAHHLISRPLEIPHRRARHRNKPREEEDQQDRQSNEQRLTRCQSTRQTTLAFVLTQISNVIHLVIDDPIQRPRRSPCVQAQKS
jgi:hypothetical protein